MLLITRATTDSIHPGFVLPAMFIHCFSARDNDTASNSDAFRRGDLSKVRSLRRNVPTDETSWCSGKHGSSGVLE
jgi:hypothetical protein